MIKQSSARLDATFGALADPTRRRLLARLARGERCVTDLARPFAISLPAVSRHLQVLERAGLVRRRRAGRSHHLRLETTRLAEAVHWLEQYRSFWEGSLDGLARYLETTDKHKTNQAKEPT